MSMIDKFQMIDELIVEVNNLLDARGVEKCRLGLDIVQRLAALKNGLLEDDKRRSDEHAEAAAE
jgi:hypothetical protein